MFMGNTPFITIRASRPLTEIEFCAWVAQAAPGDRLEYHRGFLVLDIFPMLGRLADREREELARLACAPGTQLLLLLARGRRQ